MCTISSCVAYLTEVDNAILIPDDEVCSDNEVDGSQGSQQVAKSPTKSDSTIIYGRPSRKRKLTERADFVNYAEEREHLRYEIEVHLGKCRNIMEKGLGFMEKGREIVEWGVRRLDAVESLLANDGN